LKVYLAGSLATNNNWRLEVRNTVDAIYIDPSRHDLSTSDLYTVWDLCGIRECDIVFAYMDDQNPSGIGMALEIGYAIGLRKTVILVDVSNNKYMPIIRKSVDIVFDDFKSALDFLLNIGNNIYG
jgi:nucleoside 2-deoxyribosyltransferase